MSFSGCVHVQLSKTGKKFPSVPTNNKSFVRSIVTVLIIVCVSSVLILEIIDDFVRGSKTIYLSTVNRFTDIIYTCGSWMFYYTTLLMCLKKTRKHATFLNDLNRLDANLRSQLIFIDYMIWNIWIVIFFVIIYLVVYNCFMLLFINQFFPKPTNLDQFYAPLDALLIGSNLLNEMYLKYLIDIQIRIQSSLNLLFSEYLSSQNNDGKLKNIFKLINELDRLKKSFGDAFSENLVVIQVRHFSAILASIMTFVINFRNFQYQIVCIYCMKVALLIVNVVFASRTEILGNKVINICACAS